MFRQTVDIHVVRLTIIITLKSFFFHHGAFISWKLKEIIFIVMVFSMGPEGILSHFMKKWLFSVIFYKISLFLGF